MTPRFLVLGLALLLLLPLGAQADIAELPRLRQEFGSIGALPPTHLPAPAMASGIGPGTRIIMEFPDGVVAGCTANFLWTAGDKTYLGAAGHCFLPDTKTATHGPGADYDASGVKVYACVSSCWFGGQTGFLIDGDVVRLGPVSYARQAQAGQSDIGNDFGLVEVPAARLDELRPALPVWGGPSSAPPARATGPLCFYGNSVAFGETWPTMARAGAGFLHEETRGRWFASLPATFGDSGSAVVACAPEGTAGLHGGAPLGILTHGVPGYTGGTTVTKAQQMATQANLAITLVAAS